MTHPGCYVPASYDGTGVIPARQPKVNLRKPLGSRPFDTRPPSARRRSWQQEARWLAVQNRLLRMILERREEQYARLLTDFLELQKGRHQPTWDSSEPFGSVPEQPA